MSKMLKTLALLIPIALLMSIVAPAFAIPMRIGQPDIGDSYMKVISNPDAATAAFQACEVDFLPDMIRLANVAKLTAEGNLILASPGYHYCYIAMNCRSYVPDDAEQPDAGRPLAPLNWTDFRQALLWAGLSHAEKEAAILQIYGGAIVTAVDSPVPPALGIWHWEPPYYPGCNYTKALEYLVGSGFTIAGGLLIQPNGVPVRDQIEVLSPSSAPTSVAFCQKFVNKWNDWVDNFLGVTNCNFFNNPVDFGTVLVPRAFTYRNFDMYFLCWGLGRFPDYLYDFFHSSQDYPDSNNAPGLVDPALDHDLEVVKYGTVYEEKLAHCYDAQRLLVLELCPTIELYSRTYFNAFKNYQFYTGNPNHALVNAVNEKGQGADNGWTWSLMHWSDMPQGGTANYVLGTALVNLHPGWATSAYEFDVLNRLFDGLLGVDPEMADIPGYACDWEVTPYVYEPLNMVGQKIRFQIRGDGLWHDLHPVDIYDMKFALDFLRNFPRYGPVYEYLMWTQVVDPCTIDCYVNSTSQWILYDLAGAAMLFPEHMYSCNFTVASPIIGDPDITYYYNSTKSPGAHRGGWLLANGYDPINAAVDQIVYTVGEARKALIGSGPFVFDYWNPSTSIAHIVKFNSYWVDAPIKANIIQPQKWDPCTPFQYQIEVCWQKVKETGTMEIVPFVIDRIDVTADGEVIFTIPGPIVIQPFGYWVSPPFEWHFDKCMHYMDCHIYAYGDPVTPWDSYVCPMIMSIRQDVNNDCYVGINDIFAAAAAFGSQPPPFAGYERWDERCDMNGDKYIGINDIFSIATRFGWDA